MPVLRDLTEETRMTSRVAVLDEGYAVVVGRADAPGAIRFDAALGRRELPHCSAVGKALLAAMPRADAKAILRRLGMPRRTASTLTTMSSLDDELDLTIARGYAIDNEEDTAGVVCLGTCVFDRMGKAAGAISVTGLKQNHSWKKQGRLAEALVRHADEISSRLGGPNVAVAWASKRK